MKKILTVILSLVLIFNMGCKKFLDINHSPNAVSDATLDMVLPAGIVASAYEIGGRYQVLGGIWAQHYTSYPGGPQYMAIESYNLGVSDFGGSWSSLYTNALNDLEYVKNKAAEQENWNYYLITTTMQVYTYQVLVDLYDEIPFSEALQMKPPKYDNAQTVYDGLIERLDEAINKYKNGGDAVKPGKEDLIFGGEMDKWLAFANTLKLKIFLRQTNIRPSVAELGIKAMYTNNDVFLSSDACMSDFVDQSDHSNPFYETEFKRFGNVNICASKTAVDYLKNNNDSRIGNYYQPLSEGGNEYEGNVQGRVRVDGAADPYSAPNVGGTNPVYFMTAEESMFLQAEAIARGWGTGDAEVLYVSAINENTVSTGYALYPSSGSIEDKVKAIITQKWISMINRQGLEAFFEHNRTGYPDFFTVSVTGVFTGSVKLPQRLLFPQSEIETNPDNVPTIKTVNTKVWWAK